MNVNPFLNKNENLDWFPILKNENGNPFLIGNWFGLNDPSIALSYSFFGNLSGSETRYPHFIELWTQWIFFNLG